MLWFPITRLAPGDARSICRLESVHQIRV